MGQGYFIYIYFCLLLHQNGPEDGAASLYSSHSNRVYNGFGQLEILSLAKRLNVIPLECDKQLKSRKSLRCIDATAERQNSNNKNQQ